MVIWLFVAGTAFIGCAVAVHVKLDNVRLVPLIYLIVVPVTGEEADAVTQFCKPDPASLAVKVTEVVPVIVTVGLSISILRAATSLDVWLPAVS